MKSVDVTICRVRKMLAAAGVPNLIDTVWGCGSILRAPDTAPVDVALSVSVGMGGGNAALLVRGVKRPRTTGWEEVAAWTRIP